MPSVRSSLRISRDFHLLHQFGCTQKIITRLHYEESGLVSSPEIACSLRFYKNVLSDARFRRQTKAIVIDEVHLVVDWGQSFRKKIPINQWCPQIYLPSKS